MKFRQITLINGAAFLTGKRGTGPQRVPTSKNHPVRNFPAAESILINLAVRPREKLCRTFLLRLSNNAAYRQMRGCVTFKSPDEGNCNGMWSNCQWCPLYWTVVDRKKNEKDSE